MSDDTGMHVHLGRLLLRRRVALLDQAVHEVAQRTPKPLRLGALLAYVQAVHDRCGRAAA